MPKPGINAESDTRSVTAVPDDRLAVPSNPLILISEPVSPMSSSMEAEGYDVSSEALDEAEDSLVEHAVSTGGKVYPREDHPAKTSRISKTVRIHSDVSQNYVTFKM